MRYVLYETSGHTVTIQGAAAARIDSDGCIMIRARSDSPNGEMQVSGSSMEPGIVSFSYNAVSYRIPFQNLVRIVKMYESEETKESDQ